MQQMVFLQAPKKDLIATPKIKKIQPQSLHVCYEIW